MTILVIDRDDTGATLSPDERDAFVLEWHARLYAAVQGIRIVEAEESPMAYLEPPQPPVVPGDIVSLVEAASRIGLAGPSSISRAIRFGLLTKYRSPLTGRTGVSMGAVEAWRNHNADYYGKRIVAQSPSDRVAYV
jgi:hypothetical protein